MTKLLSALLAVCALALFPAASNAAPAAAPGLSSQSYRLTTVSWVISTQGDMKEDNRYVQLIGRVTKRVGDEAFLFTDGTGTVKLDSEKFELPIGPKIVIGGRIDQAFLGLGDLEVDVREWHFPKKHK